MMSEKVLFFLFLVLAIVGSFLTAWIVEVM